MNLCIGLNQTFFVCFWVWSAGPSWFWRNSTENGLNNNDFLHKLSKLYCRKLCEVMHSTESTVVCIFLAVRSRLSLNLEIFDQKATLCQNIYRHCTIKKLCKELNQYLYQWFPIWQAVPPWISKYFGKTGRCNCDLCIIFSIFFIVL